MSTGVMDARNGSEAAERLSAQGKTLVSVQAETANPLRGLKRIKTDDTIYFATQLAVMVDTGVPLSEALDSIGESSEHPGMKAMVGDLAEQVKGGMEFSSALSKYQKIFGNLFVSLVRASEASGTMGSMLKRASEYMATARDTRKQVKGALIYPACMMVFCVLVVVGLLVFVLPRFEGIYAGKGKALPTPTRMLMDASRFIIGNWHFLLFGTLGTIGGLVYAVRTPEGRKIKDKLLIQMPMFGPLFKKACLARSLRTMSTMVTTGVAMLEGLEITSAVSGNYVYETLWNDLIERVRQGGTLAEELFSRPLVPRTIAQMIDAGERTGQLGPVMDRVAGFCEEELKVTIKALTGMIEPIMIIVMGTVVGGIAMALLLPIFKMSSVMSGK